MHELCIPMQISIRLPENKKISVGNLSMVIRELAIESKLVKQIIQQLDVMMVEKYCGPKYSRDNSSHRFKRAGTKNKKVVTSVGELDLKLHLVRDKLSPSNRSFKPVTEVLDFYGCNIYQEDISMISVELATKMTYRDSVTEGKLFAKNMPSASTINRRVIDYGEKIKNFNKKEVQGQSSKVFISDGTKCHSQEKKTKNEINVTLGLDERGEKVLLDTGVNIPWSEIAKHLNDNKCIHEEAVLVSDGEKTMVDALTNPDRKFQMDLIHTFRATSYKLWNDGGLSLSDRKAIVNRLKMILFTLKNSVEKHLQNEDEEPLQNRIDWTVDSIKELADELLKIGCKKAADFLRRCSNSIMTFAKLAIEGIIIPWTSNIIERLMGEISKRCKHKWMRWTTRGLEAILNLILVRYTSEKKYEKFKHEIMRSENLKLISCEVRFGLPGGEF